MSNTPLTQGQILVIKAPEDEKALQAVENSDAILGFHAQQAVEKLMKALLSARSLSFEPTHDLGRLETALEAAGERLPATPVPLDQLTDYSVVYRYDLIFQLTSPSRSELIDTVRLIREHVLARIAALSTGPETPPLQ